MGDEHTVSVQSSMQFFLTRLPVIVLRRVEEQFLAWREIMVGAVCLCADGRIILFYSEELYGPKNKTFCRNLRACAHERFFAAAAKQLHRP
jgi:hypothetical protein